MHLLRNMKQTRSEYLLKLVWFAMQKVRPGLCNLCDTYPQALKTTLNAIRRALEEFCQVLDLFLNLMEKRQLESIKYVQYYFLMANNLNELIEKK